MRATVMPGEDPMTLDTPDQVAEYIVPMCAPSWTDSGKLYDYRTKSIMTFQPPAPLSIGDGQHPLSRRSLRLPFGLVRERICLLAERDADRRAGQIERAAQAIAQIAEIGSGTASAREQNTTKLGGRALVWVM